MRDVLIAGESHCPQRDIECVLGHRTVRTEARKHETFWTAISELAQLFQYRDGLLRQRNDVLLTHLHANHRNDPLRLFAVKVELAPLRQPQLTRAYERQREDLQRGSCNRLTAVAVNRSQ